MNAADQEAGNRAIDSLINYETVKVIFFAIVHFYLLSFLSSVVKHESYNVLRKQSMNYDSLGLNYSDFESQATPTYFRLSQLIYSVYPHKSGK